MGIHVEWHEMVNRKDHDRVVQENRALKARVELLEHELTVSEGTVKAVGRTLAAALDERDEAKREVERLKAEVGNLKAAAGNGYSAADSPPVGHAMDLAAMYRNDIAVGRVQMVYAALVAARMLDEVERLKEEVERLEKVRVVDDEAHRSFRETAIAVNDRLRDEVNRLIKEAKVLRLIEARQAVLRGALKRLLATDDPSAPAA
jgi:hypothetical protein